MSMVIPMASRRAVPTTPNVNAVHFSFQMSRNGTSTAPTAHVDAPHLYGMPPASNVDAPPISTAPDESELVRLHAQACNAMRESLRQLTGPDCSPAMWATAIARAHRGLSALKQASALINQVEG
jgi:hypothetical protein